MARWLDDIPVFAERRDTVDARLYNMWRRARIRGLIPLQARLCGLKEMALLLEHDAWIVIDNNRGGVPVLAWVKFQDRGRSTLHTPVPCTLNFYHYMASHVRQPALDQIFTELHQRLKH